MYSIKIETLAQYNEIAGELIIKGYKDNHEDNQTSFERFEDYFAVGETPEMYILVYSDEFLFTNHDGYYKEVTIKDIKANV